jgi:hypothetical protein
VTFEPKLQLHVAPWGDASSPGTADKFHVADNTVLEGDPEQAAAAIPACAVIVANAGLQPAYRGLLAKVHLKQENGDRV